jgi:LmbE family N-acetylglucosaminyl deacetylase
MARQYLPFIVCCLLCWCSTSAVGQTPADLHQAFLDLSNDYVLMDVSAHPDDEDGSTLALYRMKYGVETYSVLFTRGEGGQNEKGSELYEELGVLRTDETVAAGKILGAQVRFLNFPDFGFSKSATEALRVWGGQMEALRRLVYLIRRERPDIIFSNHNTVGGHGHHQAAALTALAAFDAASDSTLFPEQLKDPGVRLWQPKKMFFRVFGRNDVPADVSNNIEEVDPVRGVAYLDIATQALRMHKTQGMERANLRAFSRGRSLYRLVRSTSTYDPDSTTFFSGIDLWQEPTLAPLRALHHDIQLLNESMSHESALVLISMMLREMDSLHAACPGLAPLAERLLHQWKHKLETLCGALCDARLVVDPADSLVVPRQKIHVTLRLSTGQRVADAPRVEWQLPNGWTSEVSEEPVRSGKEWKVQYDIRVGEHARFTFPRATYLYAPLGTEQSLEATVHWSMATRSYAVSRRVELEIAPPHIITVDPSGMWTSPQGLEKGVEFSYAIRNMQPHPTAGHMDVEVPAGWIADRADFAIREEDSTATGRILVRSHGNGVAGQQLLRFTTGDALATVPLHVAEIAVPKELRIGLIQSYDNTLEKSLKALGVSFKILSDGDIGDGDLSVYQTIVVDIRGYLVRESLQKQNARLLAYARSGGNLIVMYQRETEWKPEYAPYPFTITRQRVTLEDAPITYLQPSHPLLNWPNKVSARDWTGWKQERAVYFPGNVPSEYTQLVSTQDPDEPPMSTGYLLASIGSGSYIYTSFVWYRQLKEWNVSALRCFANMIAYPLRARP